jgi:hypothetical protein
VFASVGEGAFAGSPAAQAGRGCVCMVTDSCPPQPMLAPMVLMCLCGFWGARKYKQSMMFVYGYARRARSWCSRSLVCMCVCVCVCVFVCACVCVCGNSCAHIFRASLRVHVCVGPLPCARAAGALDVCVSARIQDVIAPHCCRAAVVLHIAVKQWMFVAAVRSVDPPGGLGTALAVCLMLVQVCAPARTRVGGDGAVVWRQGLTCCARCTVLYSCARAEVRATAEGD